MNHLPKVIGLAIGLAISATALLAAPVNLPLIPGGTESPEFDEMLSDISQAEIDGNYVLFTEIVGTISVDETIRRFRYLVKHNEKIGRKGNILLKIDSPGGYVSEMVRFIRVMGQSGLKFNTESIGETASAAFVFFMMGEKRIVGPRSVLLNHLSSRGGHAERTMPDLQEKIAIMESVAFTGALKVIMATESPGDFIKTAEGKKLLSSVSTPKTSLKQIREIVESIIVSDYDEVLYRMKSDLSAIVADEELAFTVFRMAPGLSPEGVKRLTSYLGGDDIISAKEAMRLGVATDLKLSWNLALKELSVWQFVNEE